MKEIMMDSKKLIIRKAKKTDAKAITEYINFVAGESDFFTFGFGQYDKSAEQEEELIESTLHNENSLIIIAEIDDKIVGCLSFSGGSRQRIAHRGELGISVLKEYWGLGVGKELLQYLIDWSKNSGIIKKINLKVRTDNIRAIRLYKKLGFLEEGVIKRDFLMNGEFYDSFLMGLLIN